MDAATHRKITLRHLGDEAKVMAEPMTGDEIREVRERAHLSQAVFPRYLNLTVGYISQLERGMKRPSGPALVLLNIIRRKGNQGDIVRIRRRPSALPGAARTSHKLSSEGY